MENHWDTQIYAISRDTLWVAERASRVRLMKGSLAIVY